MSIHTNLHPRLIVSEPDAALDFYRQVLGAELIERFVDQQDRVVHAAFSIGNAIVSLTQSVADWGLHDPLYLCGSPCLLHLSVDHPDEIASAFVANGGTIVIPVEDRPYGKREGRAADPSGHLWILSKTIAAVKPEEIARRLRGS
ncbi:MAG: VOC family protein [Alphaproteobacteria bacterium]|nr:VOC family protein [Alphaproteobacteria bacterium]